MLNPLNNATRTYYSTTKDTMIKDFKTFLNKPEWNMTILDTTADDAYGFAKKHIPDIDDYIVNFHEKYTLTQSITQLGITKRKDMPVINVGDVKRFQKFANNYPSTKKDIVSKFMVPIQRQIYVDKVISNWAKYGIESVKPFLETTVTIIDEDNHIIDGHHRWLSAMLINPEISLHTLQVCVPWQELLTIANNYTDTVGNRRNQ